MNTPKIRFKGFKDDWEQRKLGDSCKLNGRIGFRGYTEKDIVTKEIGGVLTFSPTNIVDNKLTMECKNTYITREKYDESPEIKIFNGDILFVKTGSTLGKSALVTGLKEDASINPQIVVMRVEKDKETFMSNVLITDGIKKQVTAVKIGGAVPTMTETELKNIKYYEPVEKEEQKRIGQYFEHLDHLITLHQRKCDETKELKKFMLQKMFPKNGEKNPEIRFDGFTDDWEQRKLGALMEDGIILEQSDGNHGELYPRSEEFVNEGIPYIAASSISSDGERIDFNLTKYLSMERAIQFRKGVAKNGDVLLAHNATVGPSVMLSMDYEFAILSTSLTLYRLDKEKMSPMFFLQAIRSGYFQKQLEVFMKQTTRSQVPILTQRNLQISYPINKVEQERIGEFLSNLDHLITLHQRKCEKLKELKKFMLQNMFV